MPGAKDISEISFQKLFSLMLKNKLPLIISALVGVIASLLITRFILKNQYESSTKLYVYVPVSDQQSSYQDWNAINYAQKVVNTYIQMLDTRAFYKLVNDDLGQSYTDKQMKKMIKFSVLNTTEVFQATVITESPEESLIIAQAIAKNAPQVIQNIQETAHLMIVDPPAINYVPVSPNLYVNLAVGMVTGLVLIILILYIKDALDIKIKSADELVDRYGLHILSEIGFIGEEEHKKWKPNKMTESNFTISQNYLEAYRTARTNLDFSILKKGCKKIAIVSPESKDGKTTSSVNIAIAMSQQLNVRVLLVDCDFRKPRIYRYFKVPNKPGLTNYLSGMVNLEEIVHSTAYENLTLICSGTIPPNPSELLASSAFTEFVNMMDSAFDYIIFDTSPLNLVSDSLNIVRLMDGVVISSIEGKTVHPELVRTLELLKNVNAKVTGVVLHGVNKTTRKYYGE